MNAEFDRTPPLSRREEGEAEAFVGVGPSPVDLQAGCCGEFLDLFDYDAPSWLQRIGVSDGLDLIASVSYERYFSDGDISLVDVKESDEAPGLVRFHVFAVSVNGRF